MIHSIRFTCVLDTNVIIPVEIRDLLFWFAHDDLYTPKWSKHIFDEWEEVMRRKHVSESEIKKRIGWAIETYTYCFEPSVMNYPDSDVRHWRFVHQSLQEIRHKK